MRNSNWGNHADRSHQNYTMRFHRQSRITGEWATKVGKPARIPLLAYVAAVMAVMAFWLANFL